MKKNQKKEKEKLLDVRKPKETDYVLKRNHGMKILRIIFWVILSFFFFKGILTSIQPTDEQQVAQTIDNFKQEFRTFKGENEEVMAFAQNFIREYLTYAEDDEEGYKKRLQPYISDKINSLSGITDFTSNAEATYVQAYRKEQYSDHQYDVYVLADVCYTSTSTDEEGGITTTNKTTAETYVKVPVFVKNGAYIVEDLPVFVSDSLLLGDYKAYSFSGNKASDAEVAAIKTSLLNFFTAYYGADQSVIDYYLSPLANKDTFWGLNGRYEFENIASLNCYALEGMNGYICIVGLNIKDSFNEVNLYQQYNLLIRSEGNQYYIQDMNTKTINLNY